MQIKMKYVSILMLFQIGAVLYPALENEAKVRAKLKDDFEIEGRLTTLEYKSLTKKFMDDVA